MFAEIAQLRALLGQVNDPLDMRTYQISEFLDLFRTISRELFESIAIDAEVASTSLSVAEIEKVDRIFAELSDNFFPMAHSQEALRQLQIVERRSIAESLQFMTALKVELVHLTNHVSYVVDHAERVGQDLLRYPNQP